MDELTDCTRTELAHEVYGDRLKDYQARYAICDMIYNNPVLRNSMKAAGYRKKPARRYSEREHKLLRQFTDNNPEEVEKWYRVCRNLVIGEK